MEKTKWENYLKGIFFFLLCVAVQVKNAKGAESQDEKRVSERILSEVVVTATRVAESPLEVSSFVKIITEEELRQSPAKNVGDLFPELGLGHTHKYPGALTSRISIRGISSDLFDPLKGGILLLVDGQRASTTNLAKIPLDNVERIEIIKGPFSALYGTQAMGGVINVITKTPKKEGKEITLEGSLGSFDYWKALGEVKFRKRFSNLVYDFYLLDARVSQNDYKAKDYGKIKNSAYDENTFDIKMGIGLDKNHYFSLGFQQWHGWDIGDPGPRYSPSTKDYSDKKRDVYNFLYRYNESEISFSHIFDRERWHSYNISTKIMKSNQGTFKIPFYLARQRLVLGSEFYELKTASRVNIGAPYYPNSKFKNYALFGEAKINLYKNKLYIIPGLRYDFFKTEILETPGIPSLNPKSEDKDRFSGKLGILYRAKEDLSIKVNFGSAFRTPTPDELAADYVSGWGAKYLGNATLKPEKVYSFDMGLDYAGKLGIFSLAYFYNEYDDKITSYYNSYLKANTYKNIKGATIQGFEGSFSKIFTFDKLPFSIEPFINFTYHLQYRDDENKRTLTYIPKWTSSFGVNVNYQKLNLRLMGIYQGDEKVEDWNYYSPTYRKIVPKGDFTIFNLYGSYFIMKNVEGYLKIENLFNRAYEYVQYYPMPKRSIYLGLRGKF